MGKDNFESTVWEHQDSGYPRETVFDQMLITLVTAAEFTGPELFKESCEQISPAECCVVGLSCWLEYWEGWTGDSSVSPEISVLFLQIVGCQTLCVFVEPWAFVSLSKHSDLHSYI